MHPRPTALPFGRSLLHVRRLRLLTLLLGSIPAGVTAAQAPPVEVGSRVRVTHGWKRERYVGPLIRLTGDSIWLRYGADTVMLPRRGLLTKVEVSRGRSTAVQGGLAFAPWG